MVNKTKASKEPDRFFHRYQFYKQIIIVFQVFVYGLYMQIVNAEIDLLYEQTFSSNPYWSTDQPDNFYWKSDTQTYFSKTYTGQPGYTPNRYSYVSVPLLDTSRSFSLQWDQKILSDSYASASPFGLMSSDLLSSSVTYIYVPKVVPESTVNFSFNRTYTTGRDIHIIDSSGTGLDFGSSAYGPSSQYSLDNWYRITLGYNQPSNTVTFTATNRTTGATYAKSQRTISSSGFSNGMTLLGVANDPLGYDPSTIFSRYPNSYSEAEIDNIRLLQITEPIPIARPVINDLPTRTGNATGIILIAHGTNSTPDAWANELGNLIEQRLIETGRRQDWDIVAYDWEEQANHLPANAAEEGMQIGTKLGIDIASQGYQKVHLIGHSAGAWLVDYTADSLRNDNNTSLIHTSFLDAYTPLNVGVNTLGDSSDWADHYFNDGSKNYLDGDWAYTQAQLTNAYNVDITALHIDNDQGHSWPHEWYRLTVDPFNDISQEWGFRKSEEEGTLPNYDTFEKGGLLVLGESAPEVGPGLQNITTPATTFDTLNFDEEILFTSDTGTSTVSGNSVTLVTGSPVWTVTLFDTENIISYLQLDFDFTSDEGAEGFLGIYWDNDLIGTFDERYIPDGLNTHLLELTGSQGVIGQHALSFRLDPFNDIQSSIIIQNVELGSVAAPIPPAVWLFGSGLLGLIVIARRKNHI